jgi:hypothetical protein
MEEKTLTELREHALAASKKIMSALQAFLKPDQINLKDEKGMTPLLNILFTLKNASYFDFFPKSCFLGGYEEENEAVLREQRTSLVFAAYSLIKGGASLETAEDPFDNKTCLYYLSAIEKEVSLDINTKKIFTAIMKEISPQQQKLTFLLGDHKEAGKDSSVYRAFNQNNFWSERLVLRSITEFLANPKGSKPSHQHSR